MHRFLVRIEFSNGSRTSELVYASSPARAVESAVRSARERHIVLIPVLILEILNEETKAVVYRYTGHPVREEKAR